MRKKKNGINGNQQKNPLEVRMVRTRRSFTKLEEVGGGGGGGGRVLKREIGE